MIDKYRLEDMRRESGEKGELARWVIQLQADLDREIRKSASERAMLSRLAVIMHGSETDLNLLTVTAQSLMDRCKAGNSPVLPDGWIPVSERMPGRSGVYMVWNGKHIGAVSLFFGSFQCIKPEQITHWRHMPATPQEEKAERKK